MVVDPGDKGRTLDLFQNTEFGPKLDYRHPAELAGELLAHPGAARLAQADAVFLYKIKMGAIRGNLSQADQRRLRRLAIITR